VELKNDLQVRGVLASVDQYLNLRLDAVSVVDAAKYPQLVSGGRCPSTPSPNPEVPRPSCVDCVIFHSISRPCSWL